MKKILQKLIDRLRPAWMQRERVLPDEQTLLALASVDEHSPQWRAWQEQLHGQFEAQLRIALNFSATDGQKLRALERAAALLDAADVAEANRLASKEFVRAQEEQKTEAAKRKAA